MKRHVFVLITLLLGTNAHAISTKSFLDEYFQTVDDLILEKRSEGNQKYCDKMKRAKIYDDFSYLDESGSRVIYFDIKAITVGDFKAVVKRNFECYDKFLQSQQESLIGSIFNSRAYSRDSDLIREGLNRMAGEKTEDYQKISDYFDLD